jgi:thiamine-phosphate pyrophosphorylase
VARSPHLYLITDRRLCGGGETLLARVEAALCGGVDAVQLREKDLDARSLHELAARLLEVCRRHRVPLLINDRIDVAIAVGADGVHLPADSFNARDARALLGDKLVGVSTHSLEEARAAAGDGADFAVFGPVFATPSKTAFGEPQGLDRLREVAAAAGLPILAVGGITPERAVEARAAGAAGVAAIGALLGADDPCAVARALAGGRIPG